MQSVQEQQQQQRRQGEGGPTALPSPPPSPAGLGEGARADFPILHQSVHGHPLVYLDNAATSQKPTAVLGAMTDYYERYNSNVHRGVHALSARATSEYEAARGKVAAFVGAASPQEVVYTRGASEAINLVAASWGGANLRPGDEVVLSVAEHHSNLVPWQMLAQRTGAVLKCVRGVVWCGVVLFGVVQWWPPCSQQQGWMWGAVWGDAAAAALARLCVCQRLVQMSLFCLLSSPQPRCPPRCPPPTCRFVGLDGNEALDMSELARLVGPRTRLVSLVHVSNMLGCVLPAREAAEIAHAAGALLLLDCCQSGAQGGGRACVCVCVWSEVWSG